ncbi:unnamed protein product [Calypogeia fissa]
MHGKIQWAKSDYGTFCTASALVLPQGLKCPPLRRKIGPGIGKRRYGFNLLDFQIWGVVQLVWAIIGLSSTMGQRFEKRFSVLHLSSITIAIGSIVFHATLKYSQQQCDETPMVWLMLLYIYVLYSPDWHYTSTMPTFLVIYGTAYATCHWLFHFVLVYQLHFIFLCLLCLPRMYKYYIYTTEVSARRLGHMYLISISLGVLQSTAAKLEP